MPKTLNVQHKLREQHQKAKCRLFNCPLKMLFKSSQKKRDTFNRHESEP